MELLIQLEKWGACPRDAIRRLAGDEEFYLHLLKEFAGERALSRLGNAVRDGNLRDAFREAHEIKGVAANLSLTPLYRTISAVVEDLRDPVDVKPGFPEDYQVFRKELDKFLCIIKTIH